MRSKALELQSELQQTEAKLTELQSKRNDQNSLMLTPEQEQELKRFTAEQARVRKQLRETQRGLDVDIRPAEYLAEGDQHRRCPARGRRRRGDHSGAEAPAQIDRSGFDMNRQRFIVLLVAALLVITGALYLSARRNVSREAHERAVAAHAGAAS